VNGSNLLAIAGSTKNIIVLLHIRQKSGQLFALESSIHSLWFC
jgi:hypothetical protein